MKRALLLLLAVIILTPGAFAQEESTPEPPEAEAEKTPAPQNAEDFFELAVRRFRNGDLTGAERHARTAVALDGKLADAHYLLGRVLFFQAAQKNKLLIENTGMGSAELPADPDWKEAQNELFEALGHFRTVIKFEPTNTDAWLLLATTQDNLGREDEAINAYKQTINLSPHSQNARDAHNNLGLLYQTREKWKEAKRHYEAALAIDPAFTAASLNLEKLKKKKPKIFK